MLPSGMDRVLEVGGYAAAYCGRLFAQCGCEVVRVEPSAGVREGLAPRMKEPSAGVREGLAPRLEEPSPDAPACVGDEAMDLHLHPGKRRLQTDDAAIVAALAGRADIAIAQAETADALLALGFDEWRAPVKVAITPFGRSGPKRNWRATPSTLLATGGYTYLMGDKHRAPLTLPGHYPEYQSAAFAFAAANACRLAGESKAIDISMLEVVMALSQFTTVLWHCAGVIRSRHGNDFWSVVPTNLFRCADGWVYTNITHMFWDAFTVFLGQPELALDERFASNEGRKRHRAALHRLIAEALAPRATAAVAADAERCRIPLGVVQSFDEVLADPHLAAREMWQHTTTADGRSVRSPRPPWRVDGERWPTLAPTAPVPASAEPL